MTGPPAGRGRRVLVAVSGTGGHVYPGIALAEELRERRPGDRIVFAVAAGKPGADWITRSGFEVRGIPVRGFSRRPGLSWLVFPFALLAGIVATAGLLLSFRPHLLVGTGGYVAGPFVVAAWALRIPVVLLEQNALPGVTTRMGSLLARQVHLAVPESRAKLWRKDAAVVSGNPVRRSVEEGDGAAFRRTFDLPAAGPLVVVIGGSQGAKALTEASIAAARLLAAESPVAFVVQTGARTVAEARAALDARPVDGLVLASFLDDVGGAYAAATLVVARAGAMTLAELAASGVPSVLVPYPWAAEDHQTKNARRFAANGAAVVMPQEQLTGERLAATIRELLRDATALARMAQAARGGEEAGARQRIAAACERFLG